MRTVLVAALLLAAVSDPTGQNVEIWYFGASGAPVASMGLDPPTSASVPDVDGDGHGGRTLRPGERQEFLAASGGLHIVGSPQVDIWLGVPASDEGGSIEIGLLECVGAQCDLLGAVSIDPGRSSDVWAAHSVRLPELDVRLAPGSQLCLRFDAAPGTTVTLAYASTLTPGALLLPLAVEGGEGGPTGASTSTTSVSTTVRGSDDRSDLVRPSVGPLRSDDGSRVSFWQAPLVGGTLAAVVLAITALGLGLGRRR